MDQSRREFFKRTGCAALGMAALNAGLHKFGLISALAEETAVTNYRALVCVFMFNMIGDSFRSSVSTSTAL